MTCAAIIVAAGSGSRARRDTDKVAKQYLSIGGKAVLNRTLETFLKSDLIDLVQVVISPQDEMLYQETIAKLDPDLSGNENRCKLLPPASGGDTRQSSVLNGLMALKASKPDFVLIHDAARPFVTQDIVLRCLDTLKSCKACLVASPLTDTIKRASSDGTIEETLDRNQLWAAQTPQGFNFDFIFDAHEKAALETRMPFTDDAAIAEWAGEPVKIVMGEAFNTKLTNQQDLDMAEILLKNPTSDTPILSDIRIGTGYDVHAFEEGDAVIIGGISIPHDKKLKGHSDADVALHAITDAILGAIAEGDIGTHFPPSDPQWKGASSDLFLKDAVRRVSEKGGKISNIDLTIVCEKPKIGPHRDAMRSAIAEICDLQKERISVKATTSEQLGFTGRKEGIAALATTCLRLPE
ncbi:bifunctional 2-C-methyl-D-erythritol 4-phosphate cytidylyltransferase/2-C-methyl-D-erythritol 2,4-cyclodiphosphate synthase [uncultured Cohaesibacter sp.]|uniref:bifunctional 2-C-methyl-D-erythritol 4-phosphate cytidylyltransferase/2-C-methyl-D-erythritol 2,4-cyclodiphosphate synthase n=1 Tax=uncultured Cohaesibacter sp. TaxID=1002546 RepID=UPI002931B8FC|nr:bifunctional 2-C-methyl-D-erythritol 4-phosphate cytidylyltransferase/2-C-methyl-D-erythritol 2,4-cyclodiphosphate synthase [uncultured Cohaesibacter sp.]